jgi:hypothetical protein
MAGSTTELSRQDFWMFDRAFRDGVRSSSEALFPRNPSGAPDYEDTQLVARTERYVRGLPPSQRYLVALLFIAVELFAPVLMLGWGRFSSRSVERRRLGVERMRAAWLPVYIVADALKAALTMIYLAHPKVVAFTGEFKVRKNPGDRYVVEIREARAANA